MAASVGAESERWCIVLIVVERDGSLALVDHLCQDPALEVAYRFVHDTAEVGYGLVARRLTIRSLVGVVSYEPSWARDFDPLSDPLSGENCESWRPGRRHTSSTNVLILRSKRPWRSLATETKTISGLTLNQPVLGSSPRGLTKA